MSQVNLNESHKIETKQLDMPSYLLCGPGPSNPHPRVMQAMSFHASSHFFQSFWDLLVETQELLRYVFQTDNEMTFAVSGTGSAAMECGVSSIIEKGDTVVVCSRGYWGVRMVELCERIGANVVELDGEYGVAFTYDELEMAVLEHKPKMLLMTHGESSTGVLQPMEGIGKLCHDNDCLLYLDCVVTFGGVPVLVDDWEIDVCLSGSQKCLSTPPGVSPITFSDRAVKAMEARSTPCASFYLDALEIFKYWSPEARKYHHTASIQVLFALRESLRLIAEEGLENVYVRHKECADLLAEKINELGLEFFVKEESQRIGVLNTIIIPEGIDNKAMRAWILEEYNLELAGSLYPTIPADIMRIGLMGYNSRREVVNSVVAALTIGLKRFGYSIPEEKKEEED
eukprot:TRINITY_DN1625_c0_g1_i3.p1 TRINITY_DN1625_c0_g1~~TRINITY_DN1625_c0_g1_i3.p1  ORF type:complete len:417 (+),score=131.82 TRINITY_DN1625_c0_g1_i3:57-1253(+)